MLSDLELGSVFIFRPSAQRRMAPHAYQCLSDDGHHCMALLNTIPSCQATKLSDSLPDTSVARSYLPPPVTRTSATEALYVLNIFGSPSSLPRPDKLSHPGMTWDVPTAKLSNQVSISLSMVCKSARAMNTVATRISDFTTLR